MKKFSKNFFVSMLVLILTLGFQTFVFAGEWQQDSEGWKYLKDDGKYIINNWFEDPDTGSTYHLNTFGYMDTGLVYFNDKWYYFNEDGSLRYNYFSPSDPLISTNDGNVVKSDTPGLITGLASWCGQSKKYIIADVYNMRNVPISIGAVCTISDTDFYAKFYLFDIDTKKFVNSITLEPYEQKSIFYCPLDAQPVNIKSDKTTCEFDFLCEGIDYWINTPILVFDEGNNDIQGTIFHIEP